MPNIMLTYRCNLSCEYCFANEFVNEDNIDISYENYMKAKEFILSSGNIHIGLIGGEPTIYPDFEKVLDDLGKDTRVAAVTIYTNGLEIGKYIDDLDNEKFNVLVNCNGEVNIGKRYHELEKNVQLLYKLTNAKKRITLGVNLYSNELDFNYIIDMAKKNDIHRLRMSLTVPNLTCKRNIDALEYFRSRKDFLFDFLKKCDAAMIVPYFDCNIMPYCIWSDEEYNWINSFLNKYQVKRTNLLGKECICKPVIDILPDLQCVRCFGLSEITKTSIMEFREIKDLYLYYEKKYDSLVYHKCGNVSCVDCYERRIGKCFAGCLAFYENELNN